MGFPTPTTIDVDSRRRSRPTWRSGPPTWRPRAGSTARVLATLFEENRKLVLNAAAATEEVKQLKERLLAVEAQKEDAGQEVPRRDGEDPRRRGGGAREVRRRVRPHQRRKGRHPEADGRDADGARRGDRRARTREKTQLQNQIAKLEQSIDKLRQGVPNPDQFAQPADGRDHVGRSAYTAPCGSILARPTACDRR